MKKTVLVLLAATPLLFSLSGCVVKINDDGINHDFVVDSEDRAYKNRKHIAAVNLGASIADIEEKLGVADFSETYSENEKTVKVLYYRTQRKHKDGLTTKDECTYLQFVNGELIKTGYGDEFKKS
ncbi:DUF3192 domain-containing protein [Colwellia sp. D2M02]|uniref:DUF3192 domain-containing protein n=1 Tax=Colwellia asteriadis TaxID=517723 RepID=A0ABN1L723_9GAMM|nr:DUF3192 domain-containing protein [Colwellia sp. D2M02]MBU2893961.1 DUF3192 domain-containing protein [Colwellia sp. D2M02]